MIVLEMLEAGAVGYVLKESAEEELVTAVRSVLAGEVHVTPCLRACIPKRLLSPGTFDPPRLTGRERDVLTLIANGRSRKDVATSMGVAVQSVDYHVHEIQRRLETDALSDVLRYAITRGWIDDQGARRAEAPVAGPSA
jgi:DNA-binding NarL/FixJ family response regulator